MNITKDGTKISINFDMDELDGLPAYIQKAIRKLVGDIDEFSIIERVTEGGIRERRKAAKQIASGSFGTRTEEKIANYEVIRFIFDAEVLLEIGANITDQEMLDAIMKQFDEIPEADDYDYWKTLDPVPFYRNIKKQGLMVPGWRMEMVNIPSFFHIIDHNTVTHQIRADLVWLVVDKAYPDKGIVVRRGFCEMNEEEQTAELREAEKRFLTAGSEHTGYLEFLRNKTIDELILMDF